MIDEQSRHLAYILQHAFQDDVRVIETSVEAEEAWVRTIEELAVNNQRFLEACTPGYYNNEGKPGQRSARNSSYGAGAIKFIEVLEQWRADDELAGLDLTS
jgi:cyclohexanone monooxygenase